MSAPVLPRNSWSQRLALLLSVALSPFLCVPGFCVVYARATARTPAEFVYCSIITTLLSIGVPLAYVAFHVYRGNITDIHVQRLDQRKGPFLAGISGMAAQALILHLIDAPQALVNLSLVMFAQSFVFAAISRRWKISMHTSVLAACLAGCIELADWSPTCLWLCGPLAWARKVRGRHEVSQGLAGAALGYVLTMYPLRWLNGTL